MSQVRLGATAEHAVTLDGSTGTSLEVISGHGALFIMLSFMERPVFALLMTRIDAPLISREGAQIVLI